MEDQLAIADIQQSFFEYRANFKEPIVAFWFERRHGEILGALYKALAPWHVGLQNITWNQGAKNASEIQFTFGVPSLLASMQVGIGGVTITATNPYWARAAELVSLFQAGLEALKESTAQELQSQLVTLGFHVKPVAEKSFKQILSQFVNTRALGAEDAAMYGVSVYSSDYSFVIDGSVVIPGGVFIKLLRNFSAETRFEQMAATLFEDEATVLRRLGLKLQ
jgi:hypothetical protein